MLRSLLAWLLPLRLASEEAESLLVLPLPLPSPSPSLWLSPLASK
jgi:hypothetical protein